jgi:exodeoxyribonuclease V alpha subunit
LKRRIELELSGEVLGIIYQNEINSYTIAELYDENTEKVETIVGYLPFIVEGDNLKLIGKYVTHKEYGE